MWSCSVEEDHSKKMEEEKPAHAVASHTVEDVATAVVEAPQAPTTLVEVATE